jgi:hypothetical protein
VIAGFLLLLSAGAWADGLRQAVVTPEERMEILSRAQVWRPVQVSRMNVRNAQGEFDLEEMVTCDFNRAKTTELGGMSEKFACDLAGARGHTLKVRYGEGNEEVYGTVVGMRLAWALGFGADPVYPVRVLCRSCPAFPWEKPNEKIGDHLFSPATIHETVPGTKIQADDQDSAGWSFGELDSVDASKGGAPRAQIEALELLAAMLNHVDSTFENQRLVCLPGGIRESRLGKTICTKPFLYIHDFGTILGGSPLPPHLGRPA